MIQHCSTCRYWDRREKISDGAFGYRKSPSGELLHECMRADNSPASLMWVEDYGEDGLNAAELYTAAEFGCVQHEPIPSHKADK